MDLPTCPACGQSVLDDDAVDCPFCGASMSGKPSASPAKPKPAATTPKPTSKAPEKKAAPAAPTTATRRADKRSAAPAESDDASTIEADRGAARRAIPLSRQKQKGRTFEVICPMCETVGYTSDKAAGKEVRCANPDCMVPIFTAPGGEEEPVVKAAPEREKKGMSIVTIAGLAVAVLAIAGGVGYYLFLVPKPVEISGPTNEELEEIARMMKEMNQEDAKDENIAVKDAPEIGGAEKTQDVPQGPTVAELRSSALDQIVRAAQQSQNNRSKPFCRRLAAESYVAAGDLNAAREQLNREAELPETLPYYHVPPLVGIAWSQLAAGDKDSAANTAEQAWNQAKRMPLVGRFGLDASVQLAALLLAVGRESDAKQLIESHQQTKELGQLSALFTLANNWRSFDMNSLNWTSPVNGWKAPQWTAVVFLLAPKGYADQVLKWSQSVPQREGQSEAIAAWGKSLGVRGSALSADMEQQISSLPVIDRIRFFASLAQGQFHAGAQAAAAETVAKAAGLLKDIPQAVAAELPSAADLARSGAEVRPPDAVELEIAALTLGELAQAATLTRQNEQAESMLRRAFEQTHAIGPALAVVQTRQKELASKGASIVQAELQSLLNLNSGTEARNAYNRYRTQLDRFVQASTDSFELQAGLLENALRWGPIENVENILKAESGNSTASGGGSLLEGRLAALLEARHRQMGQQEAADLWKGKATSTGSREELEFATFSAPDSAAVKEIAANVMKQKTETSDDEDWQHLLLLRLASRMQQVGGHEEALKFAAGFKNPVQREDAYQLLAARAAASGATVAVNQFERRQSPSPTERAALNWGIVHGLAQVKQRVAASTPTQSTEGGE